MCVCICVYACMRVCVRACVCAHARAYVTHSHEMGLKSHHAVPSISLKPVVGVNLGEIEIFALCRSSAIFTPYTCSFLIVFDPQVL